VPENADSFEGLNPPYSTIVADPPWPYPQPGRMGKSPHELGAGAAERYSLMSVDDLKSLPVETLAHANAHLYLWTTNAFIVEAHDLARVWGFVPKTIITWGKVMSDGVPSRKMGYYFRGATEHVVFAVRGSCPLITNIGYSTLLLARRLPHSVKPPAFFDIVERVSPSPHLELFARQPRLGWDAWGYGHEGMVLGG
jgi:N6-adenosine-specific RNA methylase IME4